MPWVVLIQVALQTTKLTGGVWDAVARLDAAFPTLTYPLSFLVHATSHVYSVSRVVDGGRCVLGHEFAGGYKWGSGHEFVESQEGRYSERCMFVYDGVMPTLMIFLCSSYGSYSYSGFRSCIVVDPYDMHGTANAIYQVRMLALKCTTRSSHGPRR